MARKKKGVRSLRYRKRVGRRIRDWRIAAGYTSQADLADYLECHHNAVGCWERGKCMPTPDSLVDIAEAVGAESVEVLLTEGPV